MEAFRGSVRLYALYALEHCGRFDILPTDQQVVQSQGTEKTDQEIKLRIYMNGRNMD